LEFKQQSNKAVSLRSLPLFRWAVPVVPQKGGTPFHSSLVSLAPASLEKKACSYYASSPSSSHTHFLRSSGLLRPQYRFITFRCAALHSAVFASTAPYFFSGCSFAQPSTSIGTLTLILIICFAIAVPFGCRYTLLSLRPRKRGSRSRVAVRGRNTAWRSSVLFREKLHNPCGASGC
jgi:hypothetical protein